MLLNCLSDAFIHGHTVVWCGCSRSINFFPINKLVLDMKLKPVYDVETPRPFISPPTSYGHATCKFPVNLLDLSTNPVNYGKFTRCMPI